MEAEDRVDYPSRCNMARQLLLAKWENEQSPNEKHGEGYEEEEKDAERIQKMGTVRTRQLPLSALHSASKTHHP